MPSLTNTPLNFFIVADVLSTVDSTTAAAQPSVAPSNITVSNGTVTGTTATGQNYTFALAPTASNAEISGRVTNSADGGLANVRVTISGGSLAHPVSVLTNGFGYYAFSEVPAGETYVIEVSSKAYTFSQPAQVVSVNSNLADINFISADQ